MKRSKGVRAMLRKRAVLCAVTWMQEFERTREEFFRALNELCLG